MSDTPFNPPAFRSLAARFRYWWRYGTWTVQPEQCAKCVTCGDWIFPGERTAWGPVHRTFDCCPPGFGGWSIHDPVKQVEQ